MELFIVDPSVLLSINFELIEFCQDTARIDVLISNLVLFVAFHGQRASEKALTSACHGT